MLLKLIEKLSKINKLSKNIIKYGSFLSFIILIFGIYIYLSSAGVYEVFIGKELIKTSFSVFAEIIIGALFFDLLSNSNFE